MYKSSFLFFSITLAAIAAGIQSGGPRWGDFTWAFKAESRADAASMNDDIRFMQSQAKAAPAILRMLWNDTRADLKELKADAAIETKLAASHLTSRPR